MRNHELMQEKLGKMTRVSGDEFAHRHVRIAEKKLRAKGVHLLLPRGPVERNCSASVSRKSLNTSKAHF